MWVQDDEIAPHIFLVYGLSPEVVCRFVPCTCRRTCFLLRILPAKYRIHIDQPAQVAQVALKIFHPLLSLSPTLDPAASALTPSP
jgi:hypothetical protein